MKLKRVHLRNFRRLENVEVDFEAEETVFVGPNNSGKTSVTTAFRLFLDTRAFTIHDFSVSRITDINAFCMTSNAGDISLPSIEMDIWFSLDPSIEFGRVFSLIPNISTSFEEVGIRLKYCVRDVEKLKSEYHSAFPILEGEEQHKSLSHYLSLPGNLHRHYILVYFSLENTEDGIITHDLDPDEGKRVLQSLIRVDFVDAQRNISDYEAGRSLRLSTAFAAYYKNNLQQAEVKEEANRIIGENNQNLNQHYKETFKDLMGIIQGLGVPSVNDRSMRIVSTLSPDTALQGTTDLLYIDEALNHELPEAYNGLGFKNLVYMAIQISHFHIQWMKTEANRPLCHIIFIEEPEVHLHAQVQQTFVLNIGEIIRKVSKDAGFSDMVPQLVITTHSSHILEAVEFRKVRYFRRCQIDGEAPTMTTTLNASKVLSLRDFKPQKLSAAGEIENENETLDFLKRYLKLTHCDLFFADAVVLVEGTVEKLLLRMMINKTAIGLKRIYITVLEVGGAYAHRFASLLEFLGIPYLVITDLDSVDPANSLKICRGDTKGAVTSNASLKFFLNKSGVSELVELKAEEHILADGSCFIAFQKPTPIKGYEGPMIGRTFEETFIYQNIQIFREKQIDLGDDLFKEQDFAKEYTDVFEAVKSSSFKKAEFALKVASSTADWETPQYIVDGLTWLEEKTGMKTKEETV